MDSRCAVHDLPTAPRLGAFGLTRWRLPTAVEIEVRLNSRMYVPPAAPWWAMANLVCYGRVLPKID